ncbi:MAG: diadenylate cyclase [Chloroflexota bacterium]|jgi:diadenylate cyclase|nr:diadenylate cyclase [Chloroflexota bacterium]
MSQTVFRNFLVFIQSRSWRDVLDIVVVSFLFYRLLLLIRGTRAVQLTFGLAVLVLVGLAARLLNLQLTYYIFSNLAPALLIGVVILFQPELRRALDRMGRVGFLGRPLAHYSLQMMSRVVDEVVAGTRGLSETRTGALIVFERTVGLENYALTGVRLSADMTAELLQTIFFPRSPLHDGAVIIRGNKVIAAGCLLPVSDEFNVSGRIGTRHRAALALSMESDALIVVVSEESGRISIVQEGQLHRGIDAEALRQVLYNVLVPKQDMTMSWIRPRRRPKPEAAISDGPQDGVETPVAPVDPAAAGPVPEADAPNGAPKAAWRAAEGARAGHKSAR